MAAIINRTRVVVVPQQARQPATGDIMIADAKDLMAIIERHVDGIELIFWDADYKCEFCGRGWKEDSMAYNGGCCDKDDEKAPK